MLFLGGARRAAHAVSAQRRRRLGAQKFRGPKPAGHSVTHAFVQKRQPSTALLAAAQATSEARTKARRQAARTATEQLLNKY